MGDGDRQRIGCIGPSKLEPRQQDTQHGLNLLFFGLSGAHNGFFYEPRGILRHGRAVARRTQQHDAARLPKLQRRLRVFVNEHFFDRRIIGPEVIEYGAEFLVQNYETIGQRQLGIGRNLAIVDMRKAIAFLADDAPAGRAQAGVETENDHPSFAITSSETS